MKKMIRMMAFVITVAYMFLLCACIQIKRIDRDTEQMSGESTANESAGVSGKGDLDLSGLDNAGVILGGTPATPPEPSASALGSLCFTLDPAHTAKSEHLPDSEAQKLEVTDAQGVKWSLEIPAGAVSSVRNITMTALNGIKGDVLTKVKSGVLLEPDGLQFVRAAHLTASGPGIDSMVLFKADHSGEMVAYEPGNRENGKITFELMHFSSAFAGSGDDPGMDGKKSDVTNALKESIKKVRAYLGEPINVPVPPDISFKCSEGSCDEPDTTALDAFMKDFMNPEKQYAEELHMAASNYGLVVGTDDMYNEAMELLKVLSSRYAKKADKLITQYSFQPDKCMAVSRVVLQGLTWCQNYGAELNYDSYFSTIATWLEKTAEKYLQDLRQKHDFKAVHAILRVGKEAELLGSTGRNYIEEVENAMRMMLRFDTTVTVQDVVYDLKGEAEVPYVLEASYQTGTGTGRYTGFKSPVEDLQLSLVGFDVTAVVENFNPCKAEEIKVYINRFGAETETYTAKGYAAPAGTGLVHSCGKWAFGDKAAQGVSEALGSSEMLFCFELPFTNESQIMAEQEYNKPISEATFRYHLSLEHKPK